VKSCLRREHGFADFLWFSAIGWTPVLVACLGIATASLAWMLAYLGVMLLLGIVEIGTLCRHCPYYSQQPGMTVHCKAMWGPTKWFRPRPGPLAALEKAALFLFFVIAFSFPIYWLVPQPKLLAIYIVTVGIMLATLTRYECNRCMFFDCPFNRVSKEAKSEAQDTAE